MNLPPKVARAQIASAIGVIVQANRLTDGKRKVTSIQEITGMEGEVITMQEIFTFRQTGVGERRHRARATSRPPACGRASRSGCKAARHRAARVAVRPVAPHGVRRMDIAAIVLFAVLLFVAVVLALEGAVPGLGLEEQRRGASAWRRGCARSRARATTSPLSIERRTAAAAAGTGSTTAGRAAAERRPSCCSYLETSGTGRRRGRDDPRRASVLGAAGRRVAAAVRASRWTFSLLLGRRPGRRAVVLASRASARSACACSSGRSRRRWT